MKDQTVHALFATVTTLKVLSTHCSMHNLSSWLIFAIHYWRQNYSNMYGKRVTERSFVNFCFPNVYIYPLLQTILSSSLSMQETRMHFTILFFSSCFSNKYLQSDTFFWIYPLSATKKLFFIYWFFELSSIKQ